MIDTERFKQMNRLLADIAIWFVFMGVGSLITVLETQSYSNYPFRFVGVGIFILFWVFVLDGYRYKCLYEQLKRGYL